MPSRLVINKAMNFRGGLEQFSNVYTLTPDPGSMSNPDWIALIDAVVSIEKSMHTNLVAFLSCFAGPPGGPVAHVRTLTGTGTNSFTDQLMHPETCLLIQAPIARGKTLAKYWHIGKYGSASTGDLIGNLATGAPFSSVVPKLTDGTLPGGAKVCNEDGQVPTGPFQADPYLRTHQFRRGRRRPQ